ncbi:hypothetical protein M3Y98_00562100 [Aphelenchoides besseyi]|nr:hypothetical protein M3Y98_00562100 [Aphelenchoides besseyi]KAI6193680.1 hypothetical protein M3Y96_01044400 [Aphelenchoides besseyi]
MMDVASRMHGQFECTRKWNEMVARFCAEVPLNANRRHWRTFPNSFSGRSAVDAMEEVLLQVFPEKDTKRDNARQVLEKLLNQGLIVVVHRSESEKFKDEKDVYYKFGKQLTSEMDKYMNRAPRRSVSVDGNRQRFAQPRMSVITDDHMFQSEPSISQSSSTSLQAACSSTSVMNSQDSINDSEQKLEINAAALRFLQWIQDCPNLSEQQRRKTLKAFKTHYPSLYRNHVANPRKSASTVSAPQFASANQKQQQEEKMAIKSTQQSEIQLNDKQNEMSNVRRPTVIRLSESDLNDRLLEKLDSIIRDTIYSEAERNRILKYFKHAYPSLYRQRFPSEQRQLLKKLREFLPRLNEVR